MATSHVREDDLSDKIEDAFVVSNKFTIALVKNHRKMQQIIHEKSGSSLLDVIEALMRLPGLRATLSEMTLPTTLSAHKPIEPHEQGGSLQHQTQAKKARELKVQPSEDKEIDNSSVTYKKSNTNLQKEAQKNKQKVDKKMNNSEKFDTNSQKESHNNEQEQMKKKNTSASKQSPTADDHQPSEASELSTNDDAITSTASSMASTTVGQCNGYSKSVLDHSDLQMPSPNNSTLTPAKTKKSLVTNVQETKSPNNSIENHQLCNNNNLKELQKFYSDIVRSLPDDFMQSIQQLQHILTDEQIGSILECTSPLAANQNLVDCLVKNVENKESILDFCDHLEKIKNSPKLKNIIEHLRKDVLSSLTQDDITKVPTTTPAGQERNPSLRAFDHHYKHMKMVNPRYVKDKFVSQDFFTNGDPYADNAAYLPNDVKMEGMLKMIRNSIALNGDLVFTQLIEVFHSIAMYAALGDKLIETYRAFGGDAPLLTCTNELIESTQSYVMSDAELEQKLKWHSKQLQKGLLYQTPPPLPSNYIPRVQLLDTITKAVMSSKVDATIGVTVILLGFGGFGKTTLARGLCHQPAIQQYFLDGILFIKLGPKPPDPEMMLVKLYDQLTNEKLQQSNFSAADKLRWYVSSYLERLLVIIDDVWDAQDAVIYADTFSTCKIVLTTRKTDVSTYIPAKNVVEIKEMSEDESKLLLTYRVVEPDRLNASAAKMLETLAQNLHRWPLLLGLVRNQLHSQVKLQSSFNQAICKVQKNLNDKGLTAFDSNITSRTSKDSAVKACVDATLDLLTQKELSNLKILVLYAGTGVIIPKSSLSFYWTDNVDDNLEKLSACGLVSISRMPLPPSVCTLSCVEMHIVITQYLVDSMNFGTLKQIYESMNVANMQLMDWSLGSSEIAEDLAFDLYDKIDLEVLQSNEKEYALFQLQLCIGFMDNIGIPLSIQRVVILTKIIQQGIVEKLELFSEHFKQNPQLVPLLAKFKTDLQDTLKTEKAYMRFIKAYKKIKSFLALNNYVGIMNALKTYLQNHPIQLLVNSFSKLTQELMQNCKGDEVLLSFIKENTDVHKNINEDCLDDCISCFEHQIKIRFAYAKLNKPNVTMEEYVDTTIDMTLCHLKWFDNLVIKKKKIMDQLESFNPEDDDSKASFNALAKTFSNMFERLPGIKTSVAEFFNIDANLSSQDFILAMIKMYIRTTPRTA